MTTKNDTGNPTVDQADRDTDAVEELIADLGYAELLGLIAASLRCDAERAKAEDFPPAVALQARAMAAHMEALAERLVDYQRDFDKARSVAGAGV